MLEDIKRMVRRFREELWNKGDLSVADEIIAKDCVSHVHDPITPPLKKGPEGVKRAVGLYRNAFPDLHITVQDILAEGGKVAVRWTSQGTHRGDLMGASPTNMKITSTGIDIYRVADGKIQEFWVNWDTMGFMQQLGLEPPLKSGIQP